MSCLIGGSCVQALKVPRIYLKNFFSGKRRKIEGDCSSSCILLVNCLYRQKSLLSSMLSCVSFPQHVITRGKKIGRIKCLLIRHSLFIFFWKVPRFKHKTDRECCRELSLLDGSSLGQSACGKSLRETRIVQNSQTITVSIHRFAYSYAFFLFCFFFILRTKGEKKENDVRNHVFGVLCPGVLNFFFF